MSDAKISFGENLFQCKKQLALCENILFEDDVMMLLGNEKSGKSVLALQLACALTSGNGTMFLDKFNINGKHPILYLQTEGKPFNDRLEMLSNAVDVDPNIFFHVYKKFFPLDVNEFFKMFQEIVNGLPVVPKVIFFDPLYMCLQGDLNDNKDIRLFIGAISRLMEKYKFTAVIIHHDRKPTVHAGALLDFGDKGSYGSVFLRAFIDHILYLKKENSNVRTLSCETDRSGTILPQSLELVLIEPNPLCFQIRGDYSAYVELVKANLNGAPMTKSELKNKTMLSEQSVDKALRILFKDNLIDKDKNYPRGFWRKPCKETTLVK